MKKKKPLTNKSGQVRELKRRDIRAMKPAREILPTSLLTILPKGKIGRKKLTLTLHCSPEVVAYFKSCGKGWEVKVDDALKEWIKKHPKRAA